MDFKHSNPFEDEYELKCFQRLLENEAESMASDQNYHQNPTAAIQRMKAIEIISKEYFETARNADDPFIPLLALTYFDRYVSRQPLQDDLNLIAIVCLSLGWKIRTTCFQLSPFLKRPSLKKFQVEEVNKMELRILSTLEWRMQTITAFSFLDFFAFLSKIDNLQSETHLKCWAAEKFLKEMYSVIEFTQFKPSIIAASALIAESISSGPRSNLREAFDPFVDRDELNRCIDKIATQMINNVLTSIRATYGSPASTSSDHD